MRLFLLLVLLLLLIGAALLGFFYFDLSGNSSQAAIPLKSTQHTTLNQKRDDIFVTSQPQVNYLPIRDFNVPDPLIEARAAGLYAVDAGRFIFNKNIDEFLPIASITKLMTAVAVSEAMLPEDIVTIAPEDVNVDGSGADLLQGERFLVRDLLMLMLIKSSNDAASTFGTYARQQGFDLVQKMNQKAVELGMTKTKFFDPSGLNDSGGSSVRDLIKLVSYINTHRPELWDIMRRSSGTIRSYDSGRQFSFSSTNELLEQIPYIIGGKTGNTNLALGTMLLEARLQEGKNMVISVVLGSRDRFGETKKLIDWSRGAFRWE